MKQRKCFYSGKQLTKKNQTYVDFFDESLPCSTQHERDLAELVHEAKELDKQYFIKNEKTERALSKRIDERGVLIHTNKLSVSGAGTITLWFRHVNDKIQGGNPGDAWLSLQILAFERLFECELECTDIEKDGDKLQVYTYPKSVLKEYVHLEEVSSLLSDSDNGGNNNG